MREPEMPGARYWLAVVALLLARPWLWWTALRQWWRSVPPRWWERSPHLPVPDRGYRTFRLHTAYGSAPPVAGDVVRWLEWCRERARGGTTRAA